jgi:SAM-dependent methyltransferase
MSKGRPAQDMQAEELAAASSRRENWSRHWASGAAHSCVGTYGPLYGGAIAAFWRAVLARLPAAARVLDIATGNGALPRLIVEDPALPARPTCDAIDLAAIAPGWIDALPAVQRQRVRFHAGVAAEDLPFALGSFDLVVSQYGIEYADLPRALAEAGRVLRPGGGFAAVMHHAQSRPVQLARLEIGHIEWLLSEAGLMAATRAMLEPLDRARSAAGRSALASDRAAELVRDDFNRVQDELTQRAARAPDGADVLFEARAGVMRAIQATMAEGRGAGERELALVTLMLADARARLLELVAHALDEPGLERAIAALGALAPHAQTAVLKEREHIMGWAVRAMP